MILYRKHLPTFDLTTICLRLKALVFSFFGGPVILGYIGRPNVLTELSSHQINKCTCGSTSSKWWAQNSKQFLWFKTVCSFHTITLPWDLLGCECTSQKLTMAMSQGPWARSHLDKLQSHTCLGPEGPSHKTNHKPVRHAFTPSLCSCFSLCLAGVLCRVV